MDENWYIRPMQEGTKEVRNVWAHSLPFSTLNKIVFESLAKSEAGTNLQQISIARFILTEILQLQSYNSDCVAKNYKECVEKGEIPNLFRIFEALFDRIVSNTSWASESKDALVRQVWKYKDEGTVDFSRTHVPKTLLITMTTERLKAVLVEALVSVSDLPDKTDPSTSTSLHGLLFACSPSTPSHLLMTMKNLYCIFNRSSFHPTIMTFTTKFLEALQSKYSWDEFWSMFPMYLQPLLIIHKHIYYPLITGPITNDDTIKYSAFIQCIENEILNVLENLYHPRNLLKRVSHRELCLDQELLSFYISSSCPRIAPLVRNKLKAGDLTFISHPSLYMYLRLHNKFL